LTDRHRSAARISAEHQFQNRPLTEGVGDDLETAALLDE
jgi:hypothetical protein